MQRATRRDFLKTSFATLALSVSTRGLQAQQRRIRTVAGTGVAGYEPDGQAGLDALKTPVNNPYGIVEGPDGALYFCEVDSGRTRRLDLKTNRLTTIAGNGTKAYVGDGGPALSASFSAPHEIRFDRAGNLYVVERDAHVVRKIDAKTRAVSTVAGTGVAGYGGDNGPAAQAQFRQPHSIAFDSSGRLLVCDIGNSRVRAIDLSAGTVSTIAGTGERQPTPDEGPLASTPLQGPRSLDTDERGNVYLVLREGNAVFQLDLAAGRLRRLAGTGKTGYTGDGGPAMAATFNGPKGIAYSSADRSLYVVDTENHVIRRINLANGLIETVAGNGERGDGPDGNPLACKMNRPHGVCVLRSVVYITDSESHRVRALET